MTSFNVNRQCNFMPKIKNTLKDAVNPCFISVVFISLDYRIYWGVSSWRPRFTLSKGISTRHDAV